MPMTIDTLEYVTKLEAAGVDRRQAEAHAAAIRDSPAPQLVTKADIDRLAQARKADLDTAVAKLEAKIGNEVAKLEAKIGNEVARLDGKIDTVAARLEGRLLLVQWMLGFNLFATLGLFGMMLRTMLK